MNVSKLIGGVIAVGCLIVPAMLFLAGLNPLEDWRNGMILLLSYYGLIALLAIVAGLALGFLEAQMQRMGW